MADKPKGDKKPSIGGGGKLKSDAEVLGTLFSIVIALVLVSALIGSFQNRFAQGGKIDLATIGRNGIFFLSKEVTDFTALGTRVAARHTLDVWESPDVTRILGSQPGGALGVLVSGPQTRGSSVWWDVDFDTAPDGWVLASDLQKYFSGTAGTLRLTLLWFSGIVTVLGIFLALYSYRRWRLITQTSRAQMQALEQKLVQKDISGHNERWERVTALIASDNPGDWRLAIMEADVMLDELVTDMQYHGETLGDKLKAIERSDFATLDSAWEAHKVRNTIAHRGSDFILTHREAKRVIGLFEQVFQEFDFV